MQGRECGMVVVPFQACILLLSVVAGVIAQIARLVRPRASKLIQTSKRNAGDTVLVCLVGSSTKELRDCADAFWDAARFQDSLRFALVVVLKSPEDVEREQHEDERLRHHFAVVQRTRVTWKIHHDSSFLLPGQKHAVRHFWTDEALVVFAYACRPLLGWDASCLEISRHARDAVITCVPSDDGIGRFPCVETSDGGARVVSRKFAIGREAEFTESTVASRRFCVYPARLLLRVPLVGGQLHQTKTIRERGGHVVTPCLPMCRPASRMGMRPQTNTHASAYDDCLGEYPSLGIVRASSDHELICKYGSVDVARAHIDAHDQSGHGAMVLQSE